MVLVYSWKNRFFFDVDCTVLITSVECQGCFASDGESFWWLWLISGFRIGKLGMEFEFLKGRR